MKQEGDGYLYEHSSQLSRGQHIDVHVNPQFTFWDSLSPTSRSKKTIEAYVALRQKALGTLESDLEEKGILGIHELLAAPEIGQGMHAYLQGEANVDGNFFLIFGNIQCKAKIEGEAHTGRTVTFAWKPNEMDTIISEIPIQKLIIRPDTQIQIPSIQFTFDPNKLIRSVEYFDYTLRISSFLNPNDYLKNERMTQAELHIHPDHLANLPITAGE